MNVNNVTSLVRSILLGFGAVLVSKGIASDAQLQEVVGALLTVVSVVWSQVHHASNPPAA